MITARGVALLAAAGLLWGVGRLLGVDELYPVAAASAVAVGVAVVAVRLSATTMAVRRGVTASRLHHDERAHVTIDLRNDARWDRAGLLVAEDECHWSLATTPRFLVTDVRPGATTALRYPITGGARGRFTVGPLRLAVRDPFGLVQLVRRYTATDEVVVYPRIETLPDGLARGHHRGSGTSDTRRLFTVGDEFHTMREYQRGDDLRRIHWRSTAHRAALMVRQEEQPWQADATVFLDTRLLAHRGSGPSSTLEQTISAAASVLVHLAERGYTLTLVTDDDTGRAGAAPLGGHLDRLAELEGSARRSLTGLAALRAGEGLLAAVVTAPSEDHALSEHPDLRALIQAGRRFPSRVAIVVHSGAQDEERARRAATMLRVAGWRAGALPVGAALAERWPDIVDGRRARGPARRAAPGGSGRTEPSGARP